MKAILTSPIAFLGSFGPLAAAIIEKSLEYKADRPLLRSHLNDALDVLSHDARTDASKLAAIKEVVSFHDGLDSPPPADVKNIKAKVLALHGADDPFVPAKDVVAFEAEVKTSGVDCVLIKYECTVHSFTHKASGTDNSKGAAYNATADRDSWLEMQKFLKSFF